MFDLKYTTPAIQQTQTTPAPVITTEKVEVPSGAATAVPDQTASLTESKRDQAEIERTQAFTSSAVADRPKDPAFGLLMPAGEYKLPGGWAVSTDGVELSITKDSIPSSRTPAVMFDLGAGASRLFVTIVAYSSDGRESTDVESGPDGDAANSAMGKSAELNQSDDLNSPLEGSSSEGAQE